MKRSIIVVLALVLLLPLAGCGQAASAEIVKSNKERIADPEVTLDELRMLVDGNNDFALDLYQAVQEKGDGNVLFSPYSLSLALAMAYAGARNETGRQMADTMHYLLPQDELHRAFNSLDQELSRRGQGAKGKDGKGFRLNIVNATWGQKDYQFLPEYLDVIAENYGAGLRLLDFINSPEESRLTINEWAREQTEGRIKDLIKQGLISSVTRMVLTNAIYFNAAWQSPFEKSDTRPAVFHLLDGKDIDVQMMHQSEEFGYVQGAGYQAVELKYNGRELAMVVLLPAEGEFERIEAALNGQMMQEITTQMSVANIKLAMPKFEYESEFSLKETLETLGMAAPFSMAADFSGMTGNTELFIKDVVHKAFIAVDEAGTEAAAASAVIMDLKGMPGATVEVNLDRPFIFFIRDIETGTILFIGRVMNPA